MDNIWNMKNIQFWRSWKMLLMGKILKGQRDFWRLILGKWTYWWHLMYSWRFDGVDRREGADHPSQLLKTENCGSSLKLCFAPFLRCSSTFSIFLIADAEAPMTPILCMLRLLLVSCDTLQRSEQGESEPGRRRRWRMKRGWTCATSAVSWCPLPCPFPCPHAPSVSSNTQNIRIYNLHMSGRKRVTPTTNPSDFVWRGDCLQRLSRSLGRRGLDVPGVALPARHGFVMLCH